MQFKKIAFFTIFFSIFFVACSSSDSKKEEDLKVKETNEYKLTTTEAQTLNIKKIENGFVFEELKGKAVLLNFFATWCPPCKGEIPHLIDLKEKYKDNLVIVAVLLEKNKNNNELKSFMNDYGINYIVTNSNQNYTMAEAVGGVQSIPTMFLYNKEGKVIQKYVGIVPEEMLEIDIKRAIK